MLSTWVVPQDVCLVPIMGQGIFVYQPFNEEETDMKLMTRRWRA